MHRDAIQWAALFVAWLRQIKDHFLDEALSFISAITVAISNGHCTLGVAKTADKIL